VTRREREALERPVRDHDARRVDTVLLGDPLLERRITARRAVLESSRPVALERFPRAVAEGRDRQEVRARHSAREGDQRHRSEFNEAVRRR
jgi:hypothetical protein